jgi:hypothetical protein
LCAFFGLSVWAEEPAQTLPSANTVDEYDLLVKADSGAGSVQIIVDGKTESKSDLKVKADARITLKAEEKEGYFFAYWEVDSDEPYEDLTEEKLKNPTLNFKMKASSATFCAVFQKKYTVTIESNELGMGNFGHKQYAPGERVKVDATPYDGFRFVRWIDQTSAIDPSKAEDGWEKLAAFEFTMPEKDVNLSIEFETITFYFSFQIQGKGEVLIDGKEKNADGKYECTVGEEILISAVPEENFTFVNWTGTNSADFSDYDKADTTLICPASDFTVTANFASSVRNLTLVCGEGGTISPEAGKMQMGVETICNLRAVADVGYKFLKWECSSKNGKFKDASAASTEFTMPEEDCTVTASFVKGGYLLKVVASAGGKVEKADGTYEMGQKVALEATALEGYVFSHWESSVKGVVSDLKNKKTEVVIPGEDLTITAVFQLKTSLSPDSSKDSAEPEESSFPWGILIVVFLLSAITIVLVIIHEKYNLSYRYLIKKWLAKKK